MFINDKDFNFVEADEKKIAELAKGKFVLALDFDGVISAPYELKAKYINELGYSIKPEESGKEDCLRLGVSKEDYDVGSIRGYTEKPGILPLEEGFAENWKNIRNLPNTFIAIVTSRYDSMLSHLFEFLKYHSINVDAVMNTKYANKGAYLDILRPHVFVEDTLKKLIEAKSQCSKDYHCKFLLYRNIQNKNHNIEDKDVIDMSTWSKINSFILEEHKKHFDKVNLSKSI